MTVTTFAFVSGNAGLDFAGTLQHRRSGPIDLLSGPAELARWVVAAGILSAEPPVAAGALAGAVELREAIYRLAAGAGAPGDRELVNRFAGHCPPGVSLGVGGTIVRTGDVRSALAAVARAAVELLGGPLAVQVRECGDETCTRLYVDTSRGGSRRWCGMAECGNRAKAAAFRARHRH